MRIAVNTRLLHNDYLEGYGYFIYETFRRITLKYPEHEFIFIFDRSFNKKFIFSGNIKPVVTGPPARHPLLWKFWYDVRIPSALRKYQADVFVSCDGICSLATKVPQCIFIRDLSFLHFPSFSKKSHILYYKKYTPKFLGKAKIITTVSEFSKQDILSHFKKTDASKIKVVYSGIKEIFHPTDEKEKEIIKEKYTSGKEFFIYAGAIHPGKNLMNLLKAFSVFKKRQQTNMKLLLAGRITGKNSPFQEKLKTYKYRDDVVMTGFIDDQELSKIFGSAYALVYPSLSEDFGVPVLEAMRCGVPVITSGKSPMHEIAKEAALYFDPANYNDIAEKMMLLYKEESLREKLINRGNEVVKQYSWDHTAELLWQSILKTVG